MQISEAVETWKQWQGQVVGGQFPLREYLGGAGGSAVFVTEIGGAERAKVAIKLLATNLADADIHLARWRKAAKLSHPHLLRVFGMGRCELGDTEYIYIVMEYAEENLGQILPERSLTTAEAEQLLDSVADALIYLHKQGLVHGHIKPANIMAVNDQVKISADGIAAAGEQNAPLQTTVYDAPEVSMGTISPASDVWSLGVTMVEALSQRAPAGRERLFLPNTVPIGFADLARHCLVRDPQGRWTFPQIMEQLQPSPVAPAPMPGAAETGQDSAKRRYVLPAMAVMALLITMFAGPKLFRIPLPGPQAQISSKRNPIANTNFSPSSVKSEPPRVSNNSLAPGSVLHQVLPNISQSARNTIQGKVRVRVKLAVDESGNVTEATFLSPGPSQYFARLAMEASRQWKFTPPQANGRPVASEWVLKFAFGRSATEVYPAQQAPSVDQQ